MAYGDCKYTITRYSCYYSLYQLLQWKFIMNLHK